MKYMYSLACLRFALMKLIVIRYLFEICLEEANSTYVMRYSLAVLRLALMSSRYSPAVGPALFLFS